MLAASLYFSGGKHYLCFRGLFWQANRVLPPQLAGNIEHSGEGESVMNVPRNDAIPDSHRALLEGPIVVSLATQMKSGQIQVQPVWCSFDGRHILVNTEKQRAKYHNLHARRPVTVLAVDPANVYHWIEVRGDVVDETEAGADAHIDQLARLYLGVDKYPLGQPGDVRVLFRITPRRVLTFGP
jgi:PPOX class probable F420-dependent enzyme